jgi:lysophospholipase L1-like esterase
VKYLLIPAIIFLLLGIYLNRSYAYFYDFQGQHFIGNPAYPQRILLDSDERFETKKLTILGDSLMAGTGSTRIENSLAYLIGQNMAKGQKIELYNFAQPGVGVDDILNRQIPEATLSKPDYIILMIGTNDVHNRMSEDEFNNKFSLILDELRSQTEASITVVNIPYIGSNKILFRPWDNVLISKLEAFNKIIAADVSGKMNIELVDLYTNSLSDFKESSDLYAPDQFHPSDKGYNLWAEFISRNVNLQ